MIVRLKNRLFSGHLPWKRRPIYQVTGGDNWALHWVAHYVCQGVGERHAADARMTVNPWSLRHSVIQFVDRYMYLNGPFRGLHASNAAFLTWYHGDLNDPNPDMQQLFESLPNALPYLKKIVVSCNSTYNTLRIVGVAAEQLEVIPIGVDLTRFLPPVNATEERAAARRAYGLPEEATVIGSFQKDGQGWGDGMAPKLVKGPDVFLETIGHLKDRVPNLHIFLTGPARGYIKQGLESLGVPYVHHQLSDYHEIVGCYAALDLYLITSRSEGGPKGLMESWARGIPVVSTRMGMPADLVRPAENGLLADVEDSAGLAEACWRMIEDTALRARCIERGLRDVQAVGWDVLSDSYYAMYKPFL